MKLFQLIAYNPIGHFEQTFYKSAKDLIEDLKNTLDDFPSFQNEIEDFISEYIEDLEEMKGNCYGKKLEFEDKSFVRIEFIDTFDID
jgi:predicted translin family RNA/ssDNA-binding protein